MYGRVKKTAAAQTGTIDNLQKKVKSQKEAIRRLEVKNSQLNENVVQVEGWCLFSRNIRIKLVQDFVLLWVSVFS